MLNTLAQTIFDKKGFNILVLDVREISTLTEFFLIAEGSVDRHVRALCQSIEKKMKEMGQKALHIEGTDTNEWIVMDYGDIIIHLFTPELRDKYRLEHVWSEGKVVDVEIEMSEVEK